MYHRLCPYKCLTHKQVNGLLIIHFKDLDMGLGFMKKIYLSTEDFNSQALLYQQIQFSKLICQCYLGTILIYIVRLLTLIHQSHL